jgi:molecular chaperone DnaJ
VPQIDGSMTRVKVPEASQTGKQFRLRGKGMPVLRTAKVGDMYIQIVVETPTNLTRRQRELLEEFEKGASAENHPESTGFFSRVRDFFGG